MGCDNLKHICFNNGGNSREARRIGMKRELLDTRYMGGSYACSGTVTRFRKEASGRGVRKLRDEAAFLGSLPKEIGLYYPDLIATGGDERGAFLEEEYIPMKNFRRHILEDNMSVDRATHFLKRILDVSYNEFYGRYKRPAPNDYRDHAYFLRFWSRLAQTIEQAPVFYSLARSPRIGINGREYCNAPSIVAFFNHLAIGRKTDAFTFDSVSPYMHGDLHLQNILIGENDSKIKLVDPRGYPICDPFYDMGKLSHSLNGKYDFIHEGKFSINTQKQKDGSINYDFSLNASRELSVYDQLFPIIYEYCEEIGDRDGVKMLFAESIHFCSDMPFHICGDGEERKAVALYITGVMILNQIIDHLDINFDENHWVKCGNEMLERTNRMEWRYEG